MPDPKIQTSSDRLYVFEVKFRKSDGPYAAFGEAVLFNVAATTAEAAVSAVRLSRKDLEHYEIQSVVEKLKLHIYAA